MGSRGTFMLRTASNPCLVRLAGEPGTVQNWLFSCWHCCMHSQQNVVIKVHVFISISELMNSYLPIGLPGHNQTLPGLGYATGLWHITWPPSNEKAIGGLNVCQSNRQMFKPLIIRGTFDGHIDQMACARVQGSRIELQAAVSLFEMPVFLCECTTSQPGHQGYKWNFYKPFPPGKLAFATLVAVILTVSSPMT